MNRRQLGRTGLNVSELCFGTQNFGWNVNEAEARALMDAYHEAGGNFFQAAAAGGGAQGIALAQASEEFVGRWWRSKAQPRESFHFATRIVMRGAPRMPSALETYVRQVCEASLRRFRVDYLDLVLVEWSDAQVPIDDLLSALTRLKRVGWVRSLGASGFSAWRLMESIHRATRRNTDRFDMLQSEFSLLTEASERRDKFELCRDYRLGFLASSPLAGGALAFADGEFGRLPTQRANRLRERFAGMDVAAICRGLADIGAPYGLNVPQTALAWVMVQPGVNSTVIGVGTPEHLNALLRVPRIGLSLEQFARPGLAKIPVNEPQPQSTHD